MYQESKLRPANDIDGSPQEQLDDVTDNPDIYNNVVLRKRNKDLWINNWSLERPYQT